MSFLDALYYIVIFSSLVVSIVFKKLWKHYFWLYFAVTIIIELLVQCKVSFITSRIYNYLDIFCIGYFGFIFFHELKRDEIIKIGSILCIVLGIIGMLFSKTHYSILTGFLYSIFLIFISLFWFYRKISDENRENNILKLVFFWISSSLLLWAIFYIFRMFPMYFFVVSDLEFSNMLKIIFQIATIVSYIIFFKGLMCEK
ncbi:hypothetical protein [Chryseobacterium gwangjuense]|uniref:hypothetical protein n=1 Tax=Chryseobacterium gwangjuense TaxID=1069980 RepID=UPI001E5CC09F|nr:hypothetical protein [Chryseobacterium gwangjuense]MCE3077065.1 hypothetical protein [Chryseobacterium gwangjuense]